jgi:hypothetical protein
MLAIPSIMIFLNGIFCAYKKIDWKIPIIIIILRIIVNGTVVKIEKIEKND